MDNEKHICGKCKKEITKGGKTLFGAKFHDECVNQAIGEMSKKLAKAT